LLPEKYFFEPGQKFFKFFEKLYNVKASSARNNFFSKANFRLTYPIYCGQIALSYNMREIKAILLTG